MKIIRMKLEKNVKKKKKFLLLLIDIKKQMAGQI